MERNDVERDNGEQDNEAGSGTGRNRNRRDSRGISHATSRQAARLAICWQERKSKPAFGEGKAAFEPVLAQCAGRGFDSRAEGAGHHTADRADTADFITEFYDAWRRADVIPGTGQRSRHLP